MLVGLSSVMPSGHVSSERVSLACRCGVDNLEIIRVFGMHNMCFVFHSHDGKGFFVR